MNLNIKHRKCFEFVGGLIYGRKHKQNLFCVVVGFCVLFVLYQEFKYKDEHTLMKGHISKSNLIFVLTVHSFYCFDGQAHSLSHHDLMFQLIVFLCLLFSLILSDFQCCGFVSNLALVKKITFYHESIGFVFNCQFKISLWYCNINM